MGIDPAPFSANLFLYSHEEEYMPSLISSDKIKARLQGEHASFLNLDVTINDGTFICKLFDRRDFFPFSIVRTSHIESNTP